MTGAPLPTHDPREPLSEAFLEERSRVHLEPARTLRFEYTSRGDRVAGRLLLPGGGPPAPLVLIGHGIGGSKDSDYLDAVAGPWVRGGAAVASIDFPLHGERDTGKFGERLQEILVGSATRGLDAFDEELWIDLVGQAGIDLERALLALAGHEAIDGSRVVYAGFSMGTILGTPFCARAPEVRAAALAIGGGGFGPAAADPARHIASFAPRPVLFVNAERDERISRDAALALHAAAAGPSEVQWFDCAHDALPGVALKAMWSFLRPHLELAAPA